MKSETPAPRPINYRILSLDGGGAKGVYTLGFLSRLEKDLGCPIRERFQLIYGTSTGSIIATLLSMGLCVDEIFNLYLKHIPAILKPTFAWQRSEALREVAETLFGGKTWSDLAVPTGIVATNWTKKQPLIFKNFDSMAHGGKSAFIPGFGAPLADAIRASCSAVPFFRSVRIKIANRGDETVDLYDGGYDIAALIWNMDGSRLHGDTGASFQTASNVADFLLDQITNEGAKLKQLFVPNGTRRIIDPEGTTVAAVLALWYELHQLLEAIKKAGREIHRRYIVEQRVLRPVA